MQDNFELISRGERWERILRNGELRLGGCEARQTGEERSHRGDACWPRFPGPYRYTDFIAAPIHLHLHAGTIC
jgi:hypothetical protein